MFRLDELVAEVPGGAEGACQGEDGQANNQNQDDPREPAWTPRGGAHWCPPWDSLARGLEGALGSVSGPDPHCVEGLAGCELKASNPGGIPGCEGGC